jgi:hypothetical protein
MAWCMGAFVSMPPLEAPLPHPRITQISQSLPAQLMRSLAAKPPHGPPRSNLS